MGDETYRCSFCGKHKDQVQKLIVGPDVGICDECIDVCADVLDDELGDWRKQVVDPVGALSNLPTRRASTWARTFGVSRRDR